MRCATAFASVISRASPPCGSGCRAPPDTACPDTPAAFRGRAGAAHRSLWTCLVSPPAPAHRRWRARARVARARSNAAPARPSRETPRGARAAPGNHRPRARYRGLVVLRERRRQRVELVHRVFQRAGDHRQAEAPDVRIGKQRVRGLVPELTSRSTWAVMSTGFSSDA